MIHIKAFTFSPIAENTYLLYNNNGNAILIDPGCYFTAEEEMLKKYITDNNLTLTKLLNTHCHLDHVFGNNWVHKTFGLEVHLHKNEEVLLQYAPTSGQNWGLPFTNYSGPLHFLQEGDTISLDEDVLQVIHTPGHSPGSISFYCAKQQFVISGDVLFYESIGRTDLPLCNSDDLLKSIKEKLFTLPNQTIVYSGHGNSTTIGHEKQHNPFLKGDV